MKDLFSPKTILSFLLGAFLFGSHFVFSFQEPTSPPPFGNALPPIHVGGEAQIKAGGLGVNFSSEPADVGFAVGAGSVIIGSGFPKGTLDITTSTSAPAFYANQLGSGYIADFRADGSTILSIGRDGLC